MSNNSDIKPKPWWIYQGNGTPHDNINRLPPAPPWRRFDGKVQNNYKADMGEIDLGRRRPFLASKAKTEIDLVNTALILRRPLLVTGSPGTGKSSLAHSVAHELKLGDVLVWSITSRSTLQDALYRYDAIGRLQETNLKKDSSNEVDIGRYVRLGPLGTALLPRHYPRVLLIDEIDKSDIDLPNDLLNIFEEGVFEISELARLPEEQSDIKILPHDNQTLMPVHRGIVKCNAFPLVIMTSNGERELPAPFLRRCIRLEIAPPTLDALAEIVQTHFNDMLADKEVVTGTQRKILDGQLDSLRTLFVEKRNEGQLATDQLLNAVHMAISLTSQGLEPSASNPSGLKDLLEHVWRYLDEP